MLSLGHAQILGSRKINRVHHLKQVNRKGKTRVIKKPMASILNCLKWDEGRVFQRVWPMEDGSVMVFFPNVIKDIEMYVTNWMVYLAANLHWFLLKKMNKTC